MLFIMLFTGCSAKTNSAKAYGSEYNMKKTKHFEIYYKDNDSSCVNDIETKLEQNYEKIINDLKPVNLPTIKVMIYPDLKEFCSSTMTSTMNPAIGTGFCSTGDTFHILSPNTAGQSKEDYNAKVLESVNEFAHCVMYNMFKDSEGKCVKWLWESVASYEAGQFMIPDKNWCPTLDDLDNSYNSKTINEFGYTLCKYIIDKWSMEDVRKLIKSNGDIESILGISRKDLEDGWHDYLRDKYSVNDTDKFYIKKTSHFEIHCKDKDKSCIDNMANKLEENYSKVVNDIKPDYVPIIKVTVCYNQEEFDNTVNRELKNLFLGVLDGHTTSKYEFYIMSPSCEHHKRSYDYVAKQAVHEFTHCITFCVTEFTPKWLNESIAQYESSAFYKPDSYNYPTISGMNEDGKTVVYNYGYILIQYIVSRWGMDGVRKLIRNRGDIKAVLGISEKDFENGWHEFMREKYPVKL